MEERVSVAEMPEELENHLKDKNLITGKTLVFASADMDVNCEIRNHVLILTEKELIHGSAVNPTTERHFSGFKKLPTEYKDFDFCSYNIKSLSNIVVDTLVVGGIFIADIDGIETPFCSFTNAFKGRINRLAEVLRKLINNEQIDEDLLFEEEYELFCPKCGTPYPESARKICPKCMDKRKIFFRLASFFKSHAFGIFIICLMSVLGSLMGAILPYLSGGVLYDEVLSGVKNSAILKNIPINDFSVLLLMLVLTMVSIVILQQLFGIIKGVVVAKIVPNVVCGIKNKVFKAVQQLSVSFFTGKRTGGLMARVTEDANQVSNIFIDGIPFILPNVFLIIFSFIVMFRENWMLAIVAVITLPPIIIVSVKLEPKLWHFYSKDFQASRDMRARLNDNVTGARVVKAFGREKGETKALNTANDIIKSAEWNSVDFRNKFTAIFQFALSISSVLTWSLGAFFVLKVFKPEMSYGTLVTFIGYVSLLTGPVNFFSYIFQWWSSSMNSAQRIFEILDAKPDVVEKPNPIRVKELKGEIVLDNVTFGYEENRDVLKHITLKVEAGKMLGIVGKSGAGKSTLANIITRLYDAKSGKIYIDGVNIRDMAFEDLRKNIAMVSQETYIFKSTIFDNIAYANPAADKKTVLKAAIAAGAHDFICKLPDGYDTIVGTGGRSLSGGERQRLSIARAILADPKILILDEATAAVDTETERKIQEALSMLIKNRTTLSIAHRLSTLRDADELIVLEDGQIVEQGTHAELIKQKGTYFKLFQIQTKALAMRGIGD
ncbi:MAG: ATP-binding cassette domain-containing protein [Clostridia bacterium]|nr:ATP-binding cassette domain-containing protein [Clostridia bacterium]